MTTKDPADWTADLALCGTTLIWGCNFPVMKTALHELHPFAFNAARILLGYFGYQVLFIKGLEHTTAGSSALLVSSSPIWTALIARVLGETLRLQVWLGLMLAFAGTVFIATAGGNVAFDDAVLLGNLLTVVSAVAWGAYTALNRPVAAAVSPVSLAFYTTAITLPLHWLIAAPHLGPVLRLELSPR